MEIIIEDIPEEGLTLAVTAADDPWVKQMMIGALANDFESSDQASLTVTCLRIGRDVDIVGIIDYSLHGTCDRCLRHSRYDEHLDLRTHLSPVRERELKRRSPRAEGNEEELWEDLEFSTYEGDRFELDAIVREQLILAQPMKRLCAPDCCGLCQRCGKNLNDGPCGCNSSC